MEGNWFVKISCAADALGCKRSDIYELLTRGLLDSIQIPGKGVMISSESLEILAASGMSFETNSLRHSFR